MIIETRSILFSDEELIKALQPILLAKGVKSDVIPDKVIIGFDSDDEIKVDYAFNASKQSAISFNSREVGAGVLNHCIEKNIPLPRGAYKEIGVRGESLALIVRLSTGEDGTGIEDDDE